MKTLAAVTLHPASPGKQIGPMAASASSRPLRSLPGPQPFLPYAQSDDIDAGHFQLDLHGLAFDRQIEGSVAVLMRAQLALRLRDALSR